MSQKLIYRRPSVIRGERKQQAWRGTALLHLSEKLQEFSPFSSGGFLGIQDIPLTLTYVMAPRKGYEKHSRAS